MFIFLYKSETTCITSHHEVPVLRTGSEEGGTSATQKNDIWVEIEGENPGGRERFTGETEETGQ